MKLFKRIKAEHASNMLDSVEVGTLSFPASAGEAFTVNPSIPDLSKGLDDALKNKMADLLASNLAAKIDADMVMGAPAQTNANVGSILTDIQSKSLIDKLKAAASLKDVFIHEPVASHAVVDAYLDFPKPAKAGSIDGVWTAKLVSVEKDLYTQCYRAAFTVEKGHNAGQTLTVSVGDTLCVNAKLDF